MNAGRTRELLQSDSPCKPYHIPLASRIICYADMRPKRSDTLDTRPGESDETLSGPPPGIIGDETGAITDAIADEVREVAAGLEANNPDHYGK